MYFKSSVLNGEQQKGQCWGVYYYFLFCLNAFKLWQKLIHFTWNQQLTFLGSIPYFAWHEIILSNLIKCSSIKNKYAVLNNWFSLSFYSVFQTKNAFTKKSERKANNYLEYEILEETGIAWFAKVASSHPSSWWQCVTICYDLAVGCRWTNAY